MRMLPATKNILFSDCAKVCRVSLLFIDVQLAWVPSPPLLNPSIFPNARDPSCPIPPSINIGYTIRGQIIWGKVCIIDSCELVWKSWQLRKSCFVAFSTFQIRLPWWCILILDLLDGWECIATHWISWFVEVHRYIGLAPGKWKFLVVRVRASFCRMSLCSFMFGLPEYLPPLSQIPPFPKCRQFILPHPPIQKCWLHYSGADAMGIFVNRWQLWISLKVLSITKVVFCSILTLQIHIPGRCILVLDFLDGWEFIAKHWISWFFEVHRYIGLAPVKCNFLVVRVRASFVGCHFVHWCSAWLNTFPPSPQSLHFPKCRQSILPQPPSTNVGYTIRGRFYEEMFALLTAAS